MQTNDLQNDATHKQNPITGCNQGQKLYATQYPAPSFPGSATRRSRKTIANSQTFGITSAQLATPYINTLEFPDSHSSDRTSHRFRSESASKNHAWYKREA